MAVQFLLNGLIAGSLYALLAVGFVLIFTTGKFFHMAHGAVYAVGAYTTWFLYSHGVSLVISIPLSIVAGLGLGWLIDRFAYSHLRARKASGLVLFIASLGLLIFFQGALATLFGNEVQVLRLHEEPKVYKVLGGTITATQVYILLVSAILLALIAYLLKRTRLGLSMRATADSKELAELCGVRTERVLLAAVLISSGCGALAGTLVALERNVEPTMGFSAILYAIVASIIGGIANVFGAFLGAFSLGTLETLTLWQLPSEYKDAVTFGVLFLFLMFRPYGLLGARPPRDGR